MTIRCLNPFLLFFPSTFHLTLPHRTAALHHTGAHNDLCDLAAALRLAMRSATTLTFLQLEVPGQVGEESRCTCRYAKSSKKRTRGPQDGLLVWPSRQSRTEVWASAAAASGVARFAFVHGFGAWQTVGSARRTALYQSIFFFFRCPHRRRKRRSCKTFPKPLSFTLERKAKQSHPPQEAKSPRLCIPLVPSSYREDA